MPGRSSLTIVNTTDELITANFSLPGTGNGFKFTGRPPADADSASGAFYDNPQLESKNSYLVQETRGLTHTHGKIGLVRGNAVLFARTRAGQIAFHDADIVLEQVDFSRLQVQAHKYILFPISGWKLQRLGNAWRILDNTGWQVMFLDLDIAFALQTFIERFYVEVKLPIIANISFLGLGKN
jgi:hypothetical protein